MAFEIDTAQEADIPELCQLLALLFEQEAEFSPDANKQSKALLEIIRRPAYGTIFIAREGDRALGMVILLTTVSTALGETVAWLEDMIVRPEARQIGVGKRLIECAIDHAKVRNIARMTLLTDHDNASAQAFYQRAGFTASAMRPMRLNLSDA